MFGLVFLIGFVGLHWRLLLFVGCVVVLVRWGRREWSAHQARVAVEAARRAEVAARADVQHREVIAGDEHGVYGVAWSAMRDYRKVA